MKRELVMTLTLAALCVTVPLQDLSAEEAAAGDAAAETPKKKPPRKQPEYKIWEQCVAAAEAWEQPIIAFVGLQGDKNTSKIKMATVNNPVFKELVGPNALYYSYMVPAAKPAKGKKVDKNAPVNPDKAAVKESERLAVSQIAASDFYPAIAVASPTGKVLGTVTIGVDGMTFGSFVNELKTLFAKGSHELKVNSKVQKAIDAEAKKLAELEKRQKK